MADDFITGDPMGTGAAEILAASEEAQLKKQQETDAENQRENQRLLNQSRTRAAEAEAAAKAVLGRY